MNCADAWGDLVDILHRHPKAAYLDIGAHEGATLERIQDECRNTIHAFEPTPASFKMLQKHHGRKPGVHLWNLALAERSGSAWFHLNANSQTNSLLDNDTGNRESFPVETEHAGKTEVTLERLDDWFARQAFPPDGFVMKCDVQGAELQVIEGGRETLQRHCLAFYAEVQLAEMYKGQAEFQDIHRVLTRESGFVLKEIYPCLHDRSGRALQTDMLWVKPSLL